MKKILCIPIIFFTIGIFIGCASPGSLRKDGAAFGFSASKGTPQEFGNCLIHQLQENFYMNTHNMSNGPDGNTTIYTMAGGQELKFMFDINKASDELNILVYGEWFQDKAFNDLVSPIIIKSLNACGATENIALRK
jgi:hypothetical protein